MTNRRTFLLGLGTALAAPAVVRASSLMKIWVPPNRQLSLSGTTAIDLNPVLGIVTEINGREVIVAMWSTNGTSSRWRHKFRLTTKRNVCIGGMLQYRDIA